MRTLRLVGYGIVGVIVGATAVPSWCQEHSAAHSHALHVRVTGAVTPDLIPDNLAYAHFILRLTQGPRQRADTLSRLHLSADDVAALDRALTGVHTELAFIERETLRHSSRGRPTVDAQSRVLNLRSQRSRIIDDTTGRLMTSLSAQGVLKLRAHIQTYVKPRIVIYGDAAN